MREKERFKGRVFKTTQILLNLQDSLSLSLSLSYSPALSSSFSLFPSLSPPPSLSLSLNIPPLSIPPSLSLFFSLSALIQGYDCLILLSKDARKPVSLKQEKSHFKIQHQLVTNWSIG